MRTDLQQKDIRRKRFLNLFTVCKKYILITLASFVNAAGISLFFDANEMAPGGVTGISIILNRLLPVETGTLILLFNIPILLFAIWKFGIRFTVSTIYAILWISFFTNLLSSFGAATEDILLAALAGSVLMGGSLGAILRLGGTTGGMDIIVKWLRIKLPHLKMGVIYSFTDAIIVSGSAFVFKNIDSALYAAIAVIVTAFVMDFVLYGADGAKLIYIISDVPERIVERLLKELDVGATYIQGSGAYSGKDKKVLMCVVKKPVSPRVEEIVREEDADSFMVITSATEVFGEGHKSYFSERM